MHHPGMSQCAAGAIEAQDIASSGSRPTSRAYCDSDVYPEPFLTFSKKNDDHDDWLIHLSNASLSSKSSDRVRSYGNRICKTDESSAS